MDPRSAPGKIGVTPWPSISVVTPSFNQARFIGEALSSVRSQHYKKYEHLVIDGMSTDGTVAILQNWNADEMSWVSERDSGQSEALNKGFRRATGDIIGWLNSDDRYRPSCFEYVAHTFQTYPEVDVIYGDYLVVDESGETIAIRREIDFSAFILHYHRVLYIPTTTTFFRRRIFDEENWLDEKLHYAMDLEFFIRLSQRGYRFMHIPRLLADFRLQPNSKTCSAAGKQRTEHQKIVLAAAPGLRGLRSPQLRAMVLSMLRLLACIRRYSEKLLRGYYLERFASR
ncbi:MAG TPA: glycosyltransferase family 2 protein [Edaphobacter sp.]|nr:glycosyltransferase family 2 protein [Edaphobacter sp.]